MEGGFNFLCPRFLKGTAVLYCRVLYSQLHGLHHTLRLYVCKPSEACILNTLLHTLRGPYFQAL